MIEYLIESEKTATKFGSEGQLERLTKLKQRKQLKF
jgi:hypothetical protein